MERKDKLMKFCADKVLGWDKFGYSVVNGKINGVNFYKDREYAMKLLDTYDDKEDHWTITQHLGTKLVEIFDGETFDPIGSYECDDLCKSILEAVGQANGFV